MIDNLRIITDQLYNIIYDHFKEMNELQPVFFKKIEINFNKIGIKCEMPVYWNKDSSYDIELKEIQLGAEEV